MLELLTDGWIFEKFGEYEVRRLFHLRANKILVLNKLAIKPTITKSQRFTMQKHTVTKIPRNKTTYKNNCPNKASRDVAIDLRGG
jgi:hypothetical protein